MAQPIAMICADIAIVPARGAVDPTTEELLAARTNRIGRTRSRAPLDFVPDDTSPYARDGVKRLSYVAALTVVGIHVRGRSPMSSSPGEGAEPKYQWVSMQPPSRNKTVIVLSVGVSLLVLAVVVLGGILMSSQARHAALEAAHGDLEDEYELLLIDHETLTSDLEACAVVASVHEDAYLSMSSAYESALQSAASFVDGDYDSADFYLSSAGIDADSAALAYNSVGTC